MSTFDSARFQELRAKRGLENAGCPLHLMALTGSTNDDALAAARAGAPAGTTFVAEMQTRGRGRRGRVWYAEAGQSLLFSLIIRERLALDRVACLSLASGVAVRRALARHLPKAEQRGELLVKWPNDVLVRGKKLAGVLAESQIEAGSLAAAVIGVGVNVSTMQFPAELEATATSLALSGGQPAREELLVDLLESLSEAVVSVARFGLEPFLDDLSRHDALVGRRVRIEAIDGVAIGIDSLGRLLVRRDDGSVTAVTSGTVELDR